MPLLADALLLTIAAHKSWPVRDVRAGLNQTFYKMFRARLVCKKVLIHILSQMVTMMIANYAKEHPLVVLQSQESEACLDIHKIK